MKKPFYKQWWVWAIIACFVWGFVMSRLPSKEVGMWSVLLLLVVIVAINMLFTLPNKRKKRKELKEKQNESKEKGTEILAKISVHHVEGLPISEKTSCELALTSNNLSIIGGGTNFNIAAYQLKAVELKTDKEIANIVHSSAVKGIAGGLLFGPIGLVVGARATNKEKKTYKHYLILNYINSTGELAAIMFNVSDWDTLRARKIVEKAKSLIVNNPVATVQL